MPLLSKLLRVLGMVYLLSWLGGQGWAQSSPPANKPNDRANNPAPTQATKARPTSPDVPQPPEKAISQNERSAALPGKPVRRFTGRPGELDPEEEDRLDAIIERFIQHDLGIRPDAQAVQEFNQLGVEAIPALVRALNRTAPLAARCPPAMIAKKLNSLMLRVQDVEVLDFIRREVGAGIRSGPNVGILDSVRFNALLRKRQLLNQPPVPGKSLFPAESQNKPYPWPGEKP